MIVASCVVTLHLPDAESLKDKRQVLRSLLRKLRDNHNVSAAEVDARDLWQKAVIGLALVARDKGEADSQLERIRADIEDWTGLKTVEFRTGFS